MASLHNLWRNTPIARKLYAVVGVMAFLIAGELLTLRFAMHTLSAVRAFVGGEGLWSKAQKNAAFNLQLFAVTGDEKYYQAYLGYLKVPEGDRRARLELSRPHFDREVVRCGFLDGNLHPDDIDPMIDLLTRFSWVSYLDHAVEVWSNADAVLERFRQEGAEFHEVLRSDSPDAARRVDLERELGELNDQLTQAEDEFSRVLGEGSRWLERVVITLLFFAVLTVESVGLTITFLTSRAISRGLSQIASAASAIGAGDFQQRVVVESRDEIGQLAKSVNEMGAMLEKSYREIERRVEERTAELARAVGTRDEFMSIASHELRTPITSLLLRIQIRKRMLLRGEHAQFTPEYLRKVCTDDEKQISRLSHTVDDMLDVSRLSTGHLPLRRERFDLCEMARDVCGRFSAEFRAARSELSLEVCETVQGEWDSFRLDQVLTNLLTNALKYGLGRPVQVTVLRIGSLVRLSVLDHGMGIAKGDQERVFQRFERVDQAQQINGLGLGLYIARQIVEAHGGTLLLNSELGAGSEFVVELPLSGAGQDSMDRLSDSAVPRLG